MRKALFLKPFQGEIDEFGNILDPLFQGGDGDGENIQPVIQILAELPACNQLFYISVGCTDKTDIGFDRIIAADAGKTAFFQNTQQLNLHFEGHFANFIQKQRAAIRRFHIALAHFDRAGIGAAFAAEKLAFEQIAGNGTTIDRNKGAMITAGQGMQGPGNKFFAAAGWSENTDRCIHGRNATHQIQYLTHGSAR